jgi:signal transduction histidine kinase
MPSPRWSAVRSLLLRHALALLLVALVASLKWALVPQIGRDAPFLLMLAPTLVVAWYGGFGPGLGAAVLSVAAVVVFSPPATPLATLHALLFGLESVAAAAAVAAVQSSRARAHALARGMRGIYEVSSALGGASTPREVAEVILHEGVAALGAASVFLHLLAEHESLRLLAYRGPERASGDSQITNRLRDVPLESDCPTALAARSRAVVGVESRDQLLARFPSVHDTWSGPLPPALLCALMIVRGHIVGVLSVTFPAARRFHSDECSWAQALAQDCGMAVERTRLFEAERRALVQSEQANHSKDEFLRVVLYELRSPLTSIVSWAHLLRATKPGDRQRYEHGLDVIERSGLSEARMVDDMLDMTRIAAGMLRVELKPSRLGSLVRSCVDELAVTAAARGVQLKMEPNGDPTVMADPQRLRQVMSNVLSNALKFTPPGGHIEVDTGAGPRSAVVHVRDDGRGISADELPHVFDAFYQADRRVDGGSSRREDGLGLGLAIARHIVQEHHGKLRIDSEGLGRGATVTIELPLARGMAGATGVSRAPRKIASATTPAIALSDFGRPEDEQASAAAGYQRFVPKPFDPRRLTEDIARLGAKREA